LLIKTFFTENRDNVLVLVVEKLKDTNDESKWGKTRSHPHLKNNCPRNQIARPVTE